MSTLRVSNLQDTSGGNNSTPAAIANGIAKAWVNFNGTGTVAIRASYNVSSITDGGVGIYTINLTTALADANYAVTATTCTEGVNASYVNLQGTTGAAATTSVALVVFSNTPAAADRSTIAVAIHR